MFYAALAPDRRAALTAEITDRTGLDEALLERVLRTFYASARADPLLGPSFTGVADWEAHIATLTRFWSAVALMTGGYHGQPMAAHQPLALTPAHFSRWLALFEATVTELCSPAGAAHLMERARRIARSLELGLTPLPLPGGLRFGHDLIGPACGVRAVGPCRGGHRPGPGDPPPPAR